jgi:hypothetical protein
VKLGFAEVRKLGHLTDKEPLNLSEQQTRILRDAISQGLTPRVKASAEDFFEMS